MEGGKPGDSVSDSLFCGACAEVSVAIPDGGSGTASLAGYRFDWLCIAEPALSNATAKRAGKKIQNKLRPDAGTVVLRIVCGHFNRREMLLPQKDRQYLAGIIRR